MAQMIQKVKLMPRYQVERLSGTRKKIVFKYVDTGNVGRNNTPIKRRVEEEIEEPAGFMLYSPKGQSVRVSEEELVALGIDPDEAPPLINEDNEVVYEPANLKSLAKQHAASNRRSNPASKE